MWSRREFLAALSASTAGAGLAWTSACGSSAGHRGPHGPELQISDVLPRLLAIVDPHLQGAYVWSRKRRTLTLSTDSNEQRVDQRLKRWVVFGGVAKGTPRARALCNATPEQLLSAAAQFIEGMPLAGHSEALTPPEQADLFVGLTRGEFAKAEQFQEPLATLFRSAQEHGSSRVVYRSAHLNSEGSEQTLLSREHNLRTRTQRTRAGVLLAAWTGDDVASAEAEVAGLGGPELVHIADARVEAAADSALSQVHARSAPSGTQALLLSPAASAMLAYRGFAAQPAIEASTLSMVDDPRMSKGYGSFQRDDEGSLAEPVTIVGASPAALGAGRRRRDDRGMLQTTASNLIVRPGTASLEGLIADIKSGVLVEGPVHASVDARGERVALLSSRGREIVNGRFTGRLFGPLSVHALRKELVDDTEALGAHSESYAFQHMGIPISAAAPHWLTRARVEAD